MAIGAAGPIGACVRARRYLKNIKLASDYHGVLCVQKAGLNTIKAGGYYTGIPDSESNLLGVHPSNITHIETVK